MQNSDWKVLILSIGKTHLEPRPASPLEVAELIQKAKNSGFSSEEIADNCDIGPTMLSKFTNLLKISRDYWHLIDWGGEGTISFSAASPVAQYNEDIQKVILDATLKFGFNKDEVSFLGQRIKRSGLTIGECIEESARKRHGPPILFWLLMGSLNSNAQIIIANLSQLERDHILKEFFDKNYPGKPIVAKSKYNGFSLIIKESELFISLNSEKEIIETKINEFICKAK